MAAKGFKVSVEIDRMLDGGGGGGGGKGKEASFFSHISPRRDNALKPSSK